MGYQFGGIAFTDAVRRRQEANGSAGAYARALEPLAEGAPGPIGPDEAAFIAARDSFYLASVSETGWPYVQHRGGPAGFLKVLDDHTLAFADFRGNRQYVSVGNLNGNNKVSLILMDYANRARLKILGHARVVEPGAPETQALFTALELPGYRARVERAMLIDVAAVDWNCPQHITPRYTMAEVERAVAPLKARLADLEEILRAEGLAVPE